MPSWRSLPQTDMVSACAGDTARFATTCSPSSTILKWPPTTTEANESCVPPRHIARSPAASALTGAPTALPQSAPSSEPPPAEASTPIRPSDRPYAGNPFSNRVEQIHCIRALLRFDCDLEPEVLDSRTGRPVTPAASIRSREELATKIGF